MNREKVGVVQRKVLRLIKRAHIILTPREQRSVEVSDFGIGDIRNIGLQVVTYVMLGWGLNIVVGLAGLLDLG